MSGQANFRTPASRCGVTRTFIVNRRYENPESGGAATQDEAVWRPFCCQVARPMRSQAGSPSKTARAAALRARPRMRVRSRNLPVFRLPGRGVFWSPSPSA